MKTEIIQTLTAITYFSAIIVAYVYGYKHGKFEKENIYKSSKN